MSSAGDAVARLALVHAQVTELRIVPWPSSEQLWSRVGQPLLAHIATTLRCVDDLRDVEPVAAVAEAARCDLRVADRRLRGAELHDDRLVACDSGRRKLRRAVAAILGAAGHPRPPCDRDLESALAVRASYARLREGLVPCDPGDLASVHRALRHASVALARLIGAGGLHDVRASDRLLLLGLRGRIHAWARDDGVAAEGARLHHDFRTALDLLRAVNLRQELRDHDAEVIACLRAPSCSDAEALPMLRRLRGRDDVIDVLVARASAGERMAALRPTLADALARLTAELPRSAARSGPGRAAAG